MALEFSPVRYEEHPPETFRDIERGVDLACDNHTEIGPAKLEKGMNGDIPVRHIEDEEGSCIPGGDARPERRMAPLKMMAGMLHELDIEGSLDPRRDAQHRGSSEELFMDTIKEAFPTAQTPRRERL
jgi:hypothetical protein